MVAYNTKEWIKPLYQFHEDDTFRKLLPWVISVAIYTGMVTFLEIRYLTPEENEHLKNLPLMHSLLGFAISMLLVFRTNTAYDRWWEGRRLWGSLVNNSRNLAVKLEVMLPSGDVRNKTFFKKLIGMFPHELRLHLQKEKTRLELDKSPHPEIPDFDRNKHVPTQIVLLMQRRINDLIKNKILSGDQSIVLNGELSSFLEICGACERIKNTPIPYSYSSFIKKFIFIYILTLPIGYVFSLGYLAIPVVIFVFYVLASLEVIAEEIEDPFGTDANDLPMEQMAANIKKNIADILQ